MIRIEILDYPKASYLNITSLKPRRLILGLKIFEIGWRAVIGSVVPSLWGLV